MNLVQHVCPTHGFLAEASDKALVYCAGPGCIEKEATGAPEGEDPKDWRRKYQERSRARLAMRAMRNNESRNPLPQAKSESSEALSGGGSV